MDDVGSLDVRWSQVSSVRFAPVSKCATVLVRAAEERTADFCRKILDLQLAPALTQVVSLVPSAATLEACFALGRSAGKKWTICVDADILLFEGALSAAVDEAETLPDRSLGLGGLLHDRFYGGPKSRGFYIYRTEWLSLLLDAFASTRSNLRPEADAKTILNARGHAWAGSSVVFGLHDFGQYYRDIFRKMATRAQRSPEDVEYLLHRALALRRYSSDFDVAIWGLRFGAQLGATDPKLTAGQWSDHVTTLLDSQGLTEKLPLDASKLTAGTVQRAILGTRSFDRTPRQLRPNGILYGLRHRWALLLQKSGLRAEGLRQTGL
jgi:hypothetical protein